MAVERKKPAKRKGPPKKRTRRAVNMRRSLVEQEEAAQKHLDTWMINLKRAIGKVDHYQGALKKARRAIAQQETDAEFPSLD